MNKFFASISLIVILACCSNVPGTETGEIQTLQLLKKAFEQSNKPKQFIDARKLISRKQIDAANIPVLFVQLESGQNGTLTPYPGEGVGKTWLGADGATITLAQGTLKATRGMGNDLMGSNSSIPKWAKIGHTVTNYNREFNYITGNNKISRHIFKCAIKKHERLEMLEIWGLKFLVRRFEELCNNNGFEIINTYYVDEREIVRRSSQYHSASIGYIIIERIER